MLCCSGIPPASGRVVVVRASINNFVAGAAMWQIHMRAFISESKLEHRHARQLQPIAQGMHLRRNVPQVLGEERQSAQSVAQRIKQVVARTIHPLAIYRRWVGSRDLPELIKSTKMVEPNVITILRCPSEPLDPPVVTAVLHHVPAV